MSTAHVICECGALYKRSESPPGPPDADAFACAICGHTLEVFMDLPRPNYRLMSGPSRNPAPTQ